ncbi:MAG: tyrosine-type recombinase/integrase [Planctomycetales bacterium]|nr:tyrosine-type recombinase/integrase [Planctomycetales bacterium]
MKLYALVETYIGYKRSLGMRFRTDANTLRAFSRAIGEVAVDDVTAEQVLAFIAGDGPVTTHWRQKYRILGSFYRYALGRGLATACPLPTSVPQFPPPLTPYIYSVNELERLLAATDTLHVPHSPLHATSMRTLLLLLYGTGMRIGEALALTLHDVDLVQQILTIHNTKFFKSRLVPIGPRLTVVLRDYAYRRCQLPMPAGEASAFIATRTGKRWHYRNVNNYFRRVRQAAGIHRESSARYQPRIHDIRHTAVLHRVVTWYQRGANVQRILPHLATYLGHVDVASTQRYLTMTAELLNEANLRFEQYAKPEVRYE